MFQDVRFAIRSLRQAPGSSVAAILILALGIGLATATFSVFHIVLIRALPVVEQDRLAVFIAEMPGSRTQHMPASRRALRDFARETRMLDGVAGAAYDSPWAWHVRDPATPRQSTLLRASVVTANLFEVLGTKAEIGRTLRAQDDALGAGAVMVISHELWQRQYGSDRGVVGRRLIDASSGTAYTIVGVMPPGLAFERGADIWRPLNAQFPIKADSDLDSPYGSVRVVGRLARGASLDAAREEFAGFMRRSLQEKNPALAPRLRAVARPFTDEVLGDIRPVLRIILAAVAVLLFVTCVNVANLILMRSTVRTPELAVRAALGATRSRIVRQLVCEGILLAIAGVGVGLLVAAAALRAIVAFAPSDLPRIANVGLDATSFGAAAVISAAAVMLFALAPALTVRPDELFAFIRSGAPSLTGARRNRRGRELLVVMQFALTFVVLSGAALLARALDRLQRLDLGYDAEHLAVLEVRLGDDPRHTAEYVNGLFRRLSERVARIPGVVATAAAIQTPFSNGGIDGWVSAEGESAAQHATDPFSDLEYVTPSYFATLGIRTVAGRVFTEQDAISATPAVVISESVAQHYWPGQSAVGKRLHCLGDETLCTVLGVVAETHYRNLHRPHLTVYRPSRQAPDPVFAPRVLLVRTTGNPAHMLALIRTAIVTGEPAITLGRTSAVRDLLGVPLAQPRLNAILVGVFATSALILAGFGMFGVLAFHVAQRTREIGLRHALGATPRQLGGMLLRDGLMLQLTGVSVGLGVSFVATRSLQPLLFGVSPTDPVALAGVCVLLIACGLAGVLIPARRASSVDPMVALRAN